MNYTLNVKKILILDDDEDDFQITSDYIQSIPGNQFKIEWCYKYEEGLKHFKNNSYDLYFIDYRLGAKTGIDFLKDAQLIQSDCPVVLLTGKGNLKIDILAMQYGAVDYLVKTELTTEKMERTIRFAFERAASTKALKTSERKYRNIFEQSKDVIFLTDLNFNFLEINSSVLDLLGITKHEAFQSNLAKFFENQEQILFIQEYLLKNKNLIDFELPLKSKAGEKLICLLTLSYQEAPLNNYFQGIIHDITHLKKMQQITLKYEKMAATRRLLQTLAHEVRNPLNNMVLAVDQLKHEIKNENNDLYLDILTRNGNRIHNIINELLNTSLESNVPFEVYDLKPILNDLLELSKDKITLKNIQLLCSIPNIPLKIKGDPHNLKLALLNIVINAIEAMNSSIGVLQLFVEDHSNHITMHIKDNGCGISTEHLSSIFDPYFTQKLNGIGLGLTFTLNILQIHQAIIEVNSELNIGTTFTIRFPKVK